MSRDAAHIWFAVVFVYLLNSVTVSVNLIQMTIVIFVLAYVFVVLYSYVFVVSGDI